MFPMKSYPHVSHLLDLPPDAAAIAFDLVCYRLAADPRGDDELGCWEVALPAGHLELVSPPAVGEARRGYCALRSVPGILRPSARWWSPGVAVDLELLPWSATKHELALTAHPTRSPAWLREGRYLRLAHSILNVVAHHLETAGDDPEAVPPDDATATEPVSRNYRART